jgi:Nodulation protein Z (NodZ)
MPSSSSPPERPAVPPEPLSDIVRAEGGVRADRQAEAGDRTVVSIRYTGLGDRLASLAAAWRYARCTGRTLVVDWRFGNFTGVMENAFTQSFETMDTLAGVTFIADKNLSSVPLPKPRYPPIWESEGLIGLPILRQKDGYEADQKEAVALIREGRDIDAGTIVFDGCVNDGIVDLEETGCFFAALRPIVRIANDVASFRRETMGSKAVVGVHVRHGNGGDIMAHSRSWDSFNAAIDRCLRAVDHARARLGRDALVFLSTDSIEVEAEFKRRRPDTISRTKSFKPPGTGELHIGADASLRRPDALTEMLLLGTCDALVRYPSGSFFSLYPAVMLAAQSGGSRTVYDLLRSWDGEALSPAIIFASRGQ